jgi:hypothetical protein
MAEVAYERTDDGLRITAEEETLTLHPISDVDEGYVWRDHYPDDLREQVESDLEITLVDATDVRAAKTRPLSNIDYDLPPLQMTYYKDEEQRTVVEQLREAEVRRILGNHGEIVGEVVDHWYYPRLERLDVLYRYQPDSPDDERPETPEVEAYKVVSTEYHEVRTSQYSEEEVQSFDERAQKLFENSPFSRRQCEVITGKERGLIDVRIAEEMGGDIARETVASHWAAARARWDEIQWAVEEFDDDFFVAEKGF